MPRKVGANYEKKSKAKRAKKARARRSAEPSRVAKSESKLGQFLAAKELRKSEPTRMITPEERQELSDKQGMTRMATDAEKKMVSDAKKKKVSKQPRKLAASEMEKSSKNRKMEKFLGIKDKAQKQKPLAPMKPQAPKKMSTGMKGY